MDACIGRAQVEYCCLKYYVLGWLPVAGAVLYNNKSYCVYEFNLICIFGVIRAIRVIRGRPLGLYSPNPRACNKKNDMLEMGAPFLTWYFFVDNRV